MKIRKNQKIFYSKGGMMVEVLIAIFIILVVVLAAFKVTQKALSLSIRSVHQSQASFLLEEGAEATRIIRDNAWSNISGLSLNTNYYLVFTGGTWTLSTTPNQIGTFTRNLVFSGAYRDGSYNLASSGTLDNQAKLVTVTVSWQDGTQITSKTLQFYIMDIFS